VLFALIQFNAGLVENMKKDKRFSRDSEEYALATVYGVLENAHEETRSPDTESIRKLLVMSPHYVANTSGYLEMVEHFTNGLRFGWRVLLSSQYSFGTG